jgi:hypothetical protein
LSPSSTLEHQIEETDAIDPASREMLVSVASDYRYSQMVRHLALDALARM